ncbi:radical SAM family heme chaperone HemW [Aquibacillus koreensis]|uniref:Heme chaperone HemW n=1 Tax=Aquibacillus koreensis TaxID=279446 RepID=A0A9X4AGH1_9BACI|nr:radical SAM family heme chaperone HemW [Aquibacillus koreensis]MCT2537616.1 radical SAM family heme chaperone HemW [Aquibacillus koreensis]MDC3419062.1 radical SAM family heme chaperone HemW [Aquibacillus koreensis]
MVSSAYIHIPFCEKICHYCDFTKFFYEEKMADDYIEALQKEVTTYIQKPKQKMKTIFVGGGTPTALNTRQLKQLLEIVDQHFEVATCEEYSFEANPGDLDEDKIKLLRDYGVNRISMGVQVFDDEMLEQLGRLHRIKDVYQNVDALKQHGIHNISIDLIYGLPNQTLNHFEHTIKEALSFDLPHYSAYSLQIEPKTVFYQRYMKGKLMKPKEEVEAQMFQVLRDQMLRHGKQQYEISNFAEPGFESKHNLTYWNNDFYYGFGAGAHGYLPGERIINLRPFPAYVKKANEDGLPVLHKEEIGLKEQIEEEMFLGLRKLEGVSKQNFFNKYDISLTELYASSIQYLKQKNWLKETEDYVQLTENGLLFGNEVFQAFLLDDETFKLSH